ncbi:hypothetical protein SNEBB_001184 [Seison nebaliae]|nr:hypothetical protein SNEBB_001184 [Seison nebaliae]
MKTKHSALFVCLGNICRSPTAEAILKDLVKKKKVESEWFIDSAATSRYQIGDPIYYKSRKVLEKNGLSTNHRARQITNDDYRQFEYIFGFDDENMANLERMKPTNSTARLVLLSEFDPKNTGAIEDPYYGYDDSCFDVVYEQCYRACSAFLDSHL